MKEMKLIRPTIKFKDSFLEALTEFQKEGLPWMMDLKIEELENDFEKYVESQLNKITFWSKDTPVDETELWAVIGDVYVGRISIRHKLNTDLRIVGGHIGYDTRPSYRGRGVASTMLKMAIPVARELGIAEALITCNDSNIPSIKVIEKNGGVLKETKRPFEGGPLKRYYWIRL